VALLWVILVDLLASLTDLLDHDKGLVRLDDPLKARYDVIWHDQEAVSLSKDRFVHARVQVDLLETGNLGALAVKRHRRADTVKLRRRRYLAVDVADDFLVASGAAGEVHTPVFTTVDFRYTWLRLAHHSSSTSSVKSFAAASRAQAPVAPNHSSVG
jgi:hypothetical protein